MLHIFNCSELVTSECSINLFESNKVLKLFKGFKG